MSAKTWADFRIELPAHAAGEALTTCPQCSASRKKKTARCLSVNIEKGAWICHHCGWRGGLSTGAESGTASHWQRPQYRRPTIAPPAQDDAQQSDKTLQWFARRAIPGAVVLRNKIMRADVYMPQREDIVPALGFPYFRGGDLVNIKWRDAEKNFRQEAGCEQVLYGIDDVADSPVWIWTEGEIDKLSVEAAGFLNCVSVPNGAPPANAREYSSKFDFLDSAAALIERASTHIIAVDSDAPGKALEAELTRRLGAERCRIVSWPEGCKDANDTLQAYGPEMVAALIETAVPLPVEGAVDLIEKRDAVMRLYENGMPPGLSTGWPSVDEFYTVKPGEMTVVTGIPNSGKSNWLDAMCVNMAAKHGWNFAVFSPENQPVEQHIARMCEKHTHKPFAPGPTHRMTPSEISDALAALNERFTIILPPQAELCTLDGILGIARQLVLRKGISGLVIDPWNEVEHDRPVGMTETEYVSVSLGKIRRFARSYSVHVWLVAHPSKLQKDRDGNYPIPTPYDISGSAHWRNKADNCVTVWRALDRQSDAVEIHVQKIRFRENGKLGTASLRWNKACGGYFDPANGAYCT